MKDLFNIALSAIVTAATFSGQAASQSEVGTFAILLFIALTVQDMRRDARRPR